MIKHVFGYYPPKELSSGEEYPVSDGAVGVLTLICSLLLLTTMLYLIVSQLKAMLKGRVSHATPASHHVLPHAPPCRPTLVR